MKYLKILGLAVIAALGLMAFAGVGTASATTLCTNSTGTICYTSGQKYDWSLRVGTSMKITSGGSTIATCTGSTIKGEQTANSPTWLTIDSTEWTWTGCSQTTHTVHNGRLTIMWTSTNSGTIEGDETEWTTEIFGVTCTYGFGAGTHLGTFTGGMAPIVRIETTVTKTAGGFLCPGTAGWDAEYELTEPHALFAVN